MSLFDMTGKVALITGSSRGIGKAVAEQMAEQGAKVVISSRKAGPCEEVAGALNAKHGEGTAIAVPANTSWSATPPPIPITGRRPASATTSSERSSTTTSSPTTG
jgi:NAD(P)-dependent dehydrogenase (short-subunit alcohol dehydrogenase family)